MVLDKIDDTAEKQTRSKRGGMRRFNSNRIVDDTHYTLRTGRSMYR